MFRSENDSNMYEFILSQYTFIIVMRTVANVKGNIVNIIIFRSTGVFKLKVVNTFVLKRILLKLICTKTEQAMDK